MNLVAIIGNVATSPELRSTPSGKAVCNFRVAVQRPGGDEADFFTVIAWERQAEVCDRYLHVGRRVGIEGRLHQSTWETEEGKRSRLEVIAHRVQLLGAPRADTGTARDNRDAQDDESAADTRASAEQTPVLAG